MIKKRYHLKTWVLPILLVILLTGLVISCAFLTDSILKSVNGDNNSYVLRNIISNDIPVAKEVSKTLIKPFISTDVSVNVSYYDRSSDAATQEKSLILYENTYMPNSGILYASENEFDIVSCLDGVVESIEDNEIFGTIVTIKHTNNLMSKYTSIKDVTVSVGDSVTIGQIIAKSASNKAVSVSQNMLLFELIYNGTNVNPEQYYDTNISELA